MTREEVKQFVDSELESCGYATHFSEIDSLSKVELIMECENKFLIRIDDDDIEKGHNWDTDMFIDYIMKKINEKE